MSSFNRENRYIVIKRSDLDKLYKDPTKYATTFGHALALIAPHLPKRQFLVIESDWPEYEPVWQMIEQRMNGAAPVVERQQCCTPTPEEKKLLEAGDYTPEELWGGNRPTCPKCINTAPPELAELKATIAKLREGIAKHWQVVCDQRSEIERLKGGQGEAVGEVADMKYNRVQFYRATGDTTKPYLLPGTKLYTSQPAPVSVVLPEPRTPGGPMSSRGDDDWDNGWNACIEKWKELNQ